MRIGILETGKISEPLRAVHGDYTAMFQALLRPHVPEAEFLTVPVVAGEMPGDVAAVDGWVITGSRHGVYDDLPWIGPLKQVLRDCMAAGVPLAGICFGHQIMAEAFGGRAEKAPQGWGLGVHHYEFLAHPGWMAGAAGGFDSLAMHRDQVTQMPPGATLLARSPFCPYAALAYGAADRPAAISVQAHPEFTKPFLRDLIETRRAAAIPAPVADRALESLSQPTRGADWGGWIARLFAAGRRERAAGAA